MDTNITQTFTNEQFGSVRTTIIDGVIYFVAADVCKALDIVNPTRSLANFNDDEKGLHTVKTPGGPQKMSVVNEPGLYRLIFMSRKPNAKDFQHWIFHNVIPDIRKFGFYATPAAVEKFLNDPDVMIRILQEVKNQRNTINELKAKVELQRDTIEAQQITVDNQAKQIDALKPKAELLDTMTNSDSVFTVTQIAKEYGYSSIRFNGLLYELEIQYRQGKCWFLYDEYANLGWVKYVDYPYVDRYTGKTRVNRQMRWTMKGRLALRDILKNEFIYPVREND